jgi:hypothetical protein
MHDRAVTSPSSLWVVTRIFQIISEKSEGWQEQLDQKANTHSHSRIWIFDDLPWLFLGHFGHFTVRRDTRLKEVMPP